MNGILCKSLWGCVDCWGNKGIISKNNSSQLQGYQKGLHSYKIFKYETSWNVIAQFPTLNIINPH